MKSISIQDSHYSNTFFFQVEAALLVAHELNRVAIPWQEIWNEGLEESWRLYSSEKDVDSMLINLSSLHQLISTVRYRQ